VGGKGIDLEDGGLEGLGAENAVKHGGVHLQGNGDSFQHCKRARSMAYRWPLLSPSLEAGVLYLRGWEGILLKTRKTQYSTSISKLKAYIIFRKSNYVKID
jgi:hypothetical protein